MSQQTQGSPDADSCPCRCMRQRLLWQTVRHRLNWSSALTPMSVQCCALTWQQVRPTWCTFSFLSFLHLPGRAVAMHELSLCTQASCSCQQSFSGCHAPACPHAARIVVRCITGAHCPMSLYGRLSSVAVPEVTTHGSMSGRQRQQTEVHLPRRSPCPAGPHRGIQSVGRYRQVGHPADDTALPSAQPCSLHLSLK